MNRINDAVPKQWTIYIRRHDGAWQVAPDAARKWEAFPDAEDESKLAKLLHACLAKALELGQPFLDRADQAPGVAFVLRGRPD